MDITTEYGRIKVKCTCDVCGVIKRVETPAKIYDTLDWVKTYMKDVYGWRVRGNSTCVCPKCEKLKDYVLSTIKR